MKEPIDKDIFLQLINRNKGIIIKICNSYCPNPSYREDLAQEIVYQLWRSSGGYLPDYTFSTWMYRIALNVAISFYRKEKTQQTLISYTNEELELAGPATENDKEKDFILLERLIGELNALDKALMILYLEARSYAEIAEILGITDTNVATRLQRAKHKLKQQFAHYKSE